MDRLALALAKPTDADALIDLWFEAFPLKFGHLMGDASLPLLQNRFEHVHCIALLVGRHHWLSSPW